MFGSVITTEAHLAYAGESTPTTPLNSRAKLARFPFMGPMARLPVIHALASSRIPSTPSVSRSPWAHFSASSITNSGKVAVYNATLSTVLRRILGMSVRTMPPHLVPLVWCRIKTYALVGHILCSIPVRCLRHVTTLVTFCKFYAMSERDACLLHNVWSEASDLSCTVSLCGLSLSRSPV